MIDIVMRTKNSAEHSPVFKKCLESIHREIPVNRLLLLDDSEPGSQTIPMVQEVFPQEAHVYGPFGNRALATQAGIDKVETDWVLIVDDDVILCQGWWEFAQLTMENETCGLIWGWTKTINPRSRSRKKLMELIRGYDAYQLCVRMFAHRGGLHDTLLRREAVAGIKLPADLHVYEDWYIKKFVEKQGFTAETPHWVWCYHYLNPVYSIKAMYEIGRLNKKYGLYHSNYMLFRLVMALPKALGVLLFTRDRKACTDQLKYYVYETLGFLRSRIQSGVRA